ncbi:NAD(P)H-quinone oxidoreductase subunit D4, partial [Nostocales cyanobacterium LEGE 12452]|nr:NAD(P)H-quinone oxidoreductase subunit D4 [Nostocales cyanobacterium LEGE 12452]
MLSVLILVPLIGAALIGFSPSGISGKFARGVALVFAIIAFLRTIVLASQFHPGE